MDTVLHNDLAHSLGIRELTYWSEVGAGGVVAPAPWSARRLGRSCRARPPRSWSSAGSTGAPVAASGGRRRRARPRAAVGGPGSYDEFFGPYGMLTPGQIFAMMARRHMIEFGTTAEQLAHIALDLPGPGQRQPAGPRCTTARSRSTTTCRPADDRRRRCGSTTSASRPTAPARSWSRAPSGPRDCRQRPVLIRAVAQASIPDPQPGHPVPRADAGVDHRAAGTVGGRHAVPACWARSCRRRRRPGLRLLLDHRAPPAGGLGLLQEGRGRAVRRRRRDRPRRARSRSTPAAATCPRATSTA